MRHRHTGNAAEFEAEELRRAFMVSADKAPTKFVLPKYFDTFENGVVKVDGCAAGHVHTAIIENLSNAWALAYRKAADHKRPFRAVSVDLAHLGLGTIFPPGPRQSLAKTSSPLCTTGHGCSSLVR